MIHIIDTYSKISTLFENGAFDLAKWEVYMNSIYEGSSDMIQNDMQECLDGVEYTYEKSVLPVLQTVYEHPSLEMLHTSFLTVTDNLNEKIRECFGRELNFDIVLYLGLCNAAGWVTNVGGMDTILLGVEKILELGWQDVDSMYGLIYHELGHAYHKQYGAFHQSVEDNKKRFVWQLFTEGIAMYFEQMLVGDPTYFHQDRDGWKDWCEAQFGQIVTDFHQELPAMTRHTQRYFGDWVSYHGRGDVGYFLGTKFVHRLREKYEFEQLINMKIDEVYEEYLAFVEANGK